MICRQLKHKTHVRYFKQHLTGLPRNFANMDSTRLVLTFFAISGLDVLNSLSDICEERRKEIINWIYNLQVENDEELVSGFQGTPILITPENKKRNSLFQWGHIANTYSALCTLLALGDDLTRVNRRSIIKSIRTLQGPDGCFTAAKEGTESDMRFVYCAACICYILNDWSGMNVEKTIDFILNSISYDFGIGQGPELESHGGPTFCAVATLQMLNRLDVLTRTQRDGIIRWLVFRQLDGFQGRPNKPVDTCYSFWIGAALKILGSYDLINFDKNYEYVMLTEDTVIGGFSKWIDTHPDPMHTYLGLGSLSLMHKENLNELVPTLNITKRAFDHLQMIHERWKNQQ